MRADKALEIMVRVLGPYIGETMARSAAQAHCQKLGFDGGMLTAEQVDTLLAKLGGGLNIFLGREKSALVMEQVRQALAAEAQR